LLFPFSGSPASPSSSDPDVDWRVRDTALASRQPLHVRFPPVEYLQPDWQTGEYRCPTVEDPKTLPARADPDRAGQSQTRLWFHTWRANAVGQCATAVTGTSAHKQTSHCRDLPGRVTDAIAPDRNVPHVQSP